MKLKVTKEMEPYGFEPLTARTTLFMSLHHQTLVKFTNLAKMRNISIDKYFDEAMKEKVESEKKKT
jgi:hypothetical protein